MKVKRYFRKNWQLWIMLLPAMLYILIFCYVPMYGIQLAFRDYDFTKGITGGAWAGLKYFKQYFDSPMFWVTLKNTFVIAFASIVVGFPIPIILAMVINQLKNRKWNKSIQLLFRSMRTSPVRKAPESPSWYRNRNVLPDWPTMRLPAL